MDPWADFVLLKPPDAWDPRRDILFVEALDKQVTVCDDAHDAALAPAPVRRSEHTDLDLVTRFHRSSVLDGEGTGAWQPRGHGFVSGSPAKHAS